MLSEKRYDSIKRIFAEKRICLSEEDLRIYADVFEIISHYINNKLTDEEMIESYDFLSDVIKNQRPEITLHVERKDRIRAQVKHMDKIPFIGDKLDLDEKVMFAFCIYLAECTCIYDEEADEAQNGVVLFTSVEAIKDEFEKYKKMMPSLFDLTADDTEKENMADFGYSIDNPILTISVGDAYDYLRRLTCGDNKITYSREGSVMGEEGHILDRYRVTVIEGKFFFKKRKEYVLYIDSYANSTSSKAPKPFILRNV